MNAIHDEYQGLLFDVRRSVRYHVRRRRFLQFMQDFGTFLSVLFGSAAAASIFAGLSPWAALIPAVAVTFTSSLSLVWGFGRKASLHSDLARRFIDLERELEAGRSNPTDELVERATSTRLLIEADEPPVLRLLDVLCHNELARAMDYGLEEYYKIPSWRRGLAQFISFSDYATRLRPVGQA